MDIKFLDLHRQYSQIKEEVNDAISTVVNNQYFILGKELENFEKEYALYLNTKYTVGVGSGTDGLIIALRALGIGKGDEVITQPNSFIATALAITQVGATPVFVDADKDTYQINTQEIEKKITKKTKAILPVHLYGAPCEIDRIKEIAKAHKLFLVEDAAQAHGATYKGKKVGTFGDIGIYSFYPGKNLGAYGDGGAISTNNDDIYKRILLLRNYGQSKKYFHDSIGINSRLDEIQAAVLRVKLRYIDRWNNERNEKAKQYHKLLDNIKYQVVYPEGMSNYHVFIIEHPKRDKLQQYLHEKGIQTLIHYPLPIHLQKCYNYLGYKIGDFPISEGLSDTILSLPMYAELKEQEIEYIAKTVRIFR